MTHPSRSGEPSRTTEGCKVSQEEGGQKSNEFRCFLLPTLSGAGDCVPCRHFRRHSSYCEAFSFSLHEGAASKREEVHVPSPALPRRAPAFLLCARGVARLCHCRTGER